MIRQLVWSSIKGRKGSFGLFLLICVLIFIIIPLSIGSLQEVHTEVESNITHYARGSYDLLVRAEGYQHDLEEELGVVPENYLGVGDGGITIEQWETIKDHPEIEIAAPIASLGYYTGIRANIGISPIPEESTRYIMQYYTSDGVNRYPIRDEYIGFLLETPLSEQKFEIVINKPEELLNEFRETAPMFPFPIAYHLMVGIDPEAESKLTGIPFEEIKQDSGASGWGSIQRNDIGSDAPIIPVMQLKEGAVSLQADIKVDTLGMGIEDVQVYRDKLGLDDRKIPEEVQNYLFINIVSQEYDDLVEELSNLKEVERQEIQIDLQDHLHPFPLEEESLVVNEDGELAPMVPDGKYLGLIDMFYSSTYYTAGHVKYEQDGDTLRVNQVGVQDGVPTYRKVEKKGLDLREFFDSEAEQDIDLMLDSVGEYSIGEKTEQLAASPLGIYQLEPVKFIGDGETDAISMMATITPGSFVPAPANGVTNIGAAAEVKGPKPIDAIRVKIAGISEYTPEAADKIERIAEEIEAMGLQVSIVAGASHQFIDVEVEGVGLVQEAWTTLGAAGSIISQWNITNLILALFFILVAFLYMYNRILFWQVQKERDILLLRQLGWKNKQVLKLFMGEIGISTFLSWLLALGGLFIVQFVFQTSSSIYLWQIGILGTTFFLLSYLMYTKIQRNQKRKNIHFFEKRHKSILLKNISYFSEYINPSFVQLLVVSALSSFVFLSLTKTVEDTNLTVLGQYINVQTSGWHFLLVISVYIIAISTLAEGLTSLLTSRQREIGTFRSLGWKRFHIFKLYFKEVLIWSGIAISVGHAISFLIYMIIYGLGKGALLIVGGSLIGIYICTAIVSAFMLHLLLGKNLGNTIALKRKRIKEKQVG